MTNQKKRILVVDDQPDITRMLKLNLEQTNEYEVCMENDPLRAMTAAEQFQPDLILLDVLMPGMDGGDLASRFQANPKVNKAKVIFLTAAVTKTEVSSHKGLIGGLPFVAKPVNMQELTGRLRQCLG